MKPITDLLHRTPWWALLMGGLVILAALAAFVTPYHIIDYRRDASTAEQKKAIKREINNAFADNAIDIARNVLRGLRSSSSDPKRRDEIEQALESLDAARAELREAGVEALRAKREAAQDANAAVKEATQAIEEAQKEAERALKDAGVESGQVRKSLEESLAAARRAQEEAKAAAERAAHETRAEIGTQARIVEEKGKRRIVISSGTSKKPMIDIELDATAPRADPPPPPALPGGLAPPTPPEPPAKVDLPPEVKSEIRRNVTQDLYRMGLGAGLVLILIPLFIVVVVAKFFIDRSRAAMRMAELKRKEAEYHRLSQQVTEAKLSALQAQVEPHFLYNTLASVQALTEVDPARAYQMTGHLIQYLRNALPKMRESVSTVGQEVELVRAYLNILQMRMGKRLAFTIEVPAELLEVPFPPLMLPSLVENAIKHGLEPQREGGTVNIRVESAGGRLHMIVADTGRGFGESPGAGVGLANIRERLAAMHGDDARLTLVANEPQGVVATIDVPRNPGREWTGAAASGTGTTATGSAPSGEEASAGAETAASAPGAGTPPRTRTEKVLAALATGERIWRKAMWYTFLGLSVVTVVLAAVGLIGVLTGLMPVQLGREVPSGPLGALIGTAGILVGLVAVIAAIAVVMAVFYGLGFLLVGVIAVLIVVAAISLFPVLSPFIVVGLAIWWFARRQRKEKVAAAAPAPAEPPAPAAPVAPLDPQEPPPLPPEARGPATP